MAILGDSYLMFIDTVSGIDKVPTTDEYFRPIVCLKTQDLDVTTEVITIQNKCDGGYTKKRPGYGSWSMSADGHAVGLRNAEKTIKANFHEVMQLNIDKVMFWAAFRDLEKSIWRVGLGFFTSVRESANINEPYSFSLSFEGSGKLQIGTDLFLTLLARDNNKDEFLEGGEDNLIKVNGNGNIIIPDGSGNVWDDNATWGD